MIKFLAMIQEATKIEYLDHNNKPTGKYWYRKKINIHESSNGSNQKNSDIFIDYANHTYQSINSVNTPSPTIAGIAHELIHLLHNWNNATYMTISTSAGGKCLIENMDNLEEQQTIIGLNSTLIEFKGINNLNKIDFLCENAFLLALGLPARINHKGEKSTLADSPEISYDIKKIRDNIKNYFAWLETVIPIAIPE